MDEEGNEAERRNYIFCMTWIQRGVAATVPDKIEFSPEELQNIIQNTHSELQGAKDENDDSDDNLDDLTKSTKCKDANKDNESKENDEEMDDDANDEFKFDKYDDECL